MNYFLLGLALLSCTSLAQARQPLAEREGYYYESRPRLGHFKDEPFTDLYKTYAAAFVTPLYPDRPLDDYRNYVPSGDECMVFFRKFRVDEYNLRDLDDFVVLDACLGYLYNSDYHAEDSQKSSQVRDNLKALQEDPKLQQLYHETKIDSLPDEAKECVGNLFLDVIRAKAQYPDVVCNNHFLGLFNRYAKCQRETVPEEFRLNDVYGSLLFSLVKQRGSECFHYEINRMNVAVRKEYANNPFSRAGNFLFGVHNKLRNQAGKRYWPKEIVELLSAVQGTHKEINLREVSNIIRGVAVDHKEFKARLLRNLAKYANEKINPRLDSKATAADPSGDKRYRALVDKVCNFFRQSDYKNYYDYATPFVRMVKMLEYPEVFDITEKYLVSKVLTHSFESAAIYASVSSCNILTFTEAQFEQTIPNHELKYKVIFVPDISTMVQWPNAGYY